MNPKTPRLLALSRWLLRRWARLRATLFERRKGVLVYLGMHQGREFDLIFKSYRECYGFEANPKLFAILQDKYRDHPHVKLFNYAVAAAAGQVSFNISSNQGASSSLGTFDEQWWNFSSGEVKIVETITVPSINLYDFCREQGIARIDDYVSDIQGMDLEVLKTMKPYLDERRIVSLTVETTRDGRRNIYKDLPDNSESGFRELLQDNYKLVGMGYGLLHDYWFADVPAGAWEFDCKWRRRLLPAGPRDAPLARTPAPHAGEAADK